jgi:hypothetical protein
VTEPWARPTSLQITFDDISDKQTFARLREFSRQEHTEECFDFLAAVVEYRKEPSSSSAIDIINTFIRVCYIVCYDLLVFETRLFYRRAGGKDRALW